MMVAEVGALQPPIRVTCDGPGLPPLDIMGLWKTTRGFSKEVKKIRIDLKAEGAAASEEEAGAERSAEDDIISAIYEGAEREVLLETYFQAWKETSLEFRKAQEFKALYYRNFCLMQRAFRGWKLITWEAVKSRELEKQILERELEEAKEVKAEAFRQLRTVQRLFTRWQAHSRLMAAKRQLISLRKRKDLAKTSVQNFLKNLDTLERDKKVGKGPMEIKGGLRPTSCSAIKDPQPKSRKSSTTSSGKDHSCQQPRTRSASQFRKLKEQSLAMEHQRGQTKQQGKEIECLKELKSQLDKGQNVTNRELFETISQPDFIDCGQTYPHEKGFGEHLVTYGGATLPAIPCHQRNPPIFAADLLDLQSKSTSISIVTGHLSISYGMLRTTSTVIDIADYRKVMQQPIIRDILVDESHLTGRHGEVKEKAMGSEESGHFFYKPPDLDPFIEPEQQVCSEAGQAEGSLKNPEKTISDSSKKCSRPQQPDPDYLINMKIRQRELQQRRDHLRRMQQLKAEEKLNDLREKEALKARYDREEKERVKAERAELRKKIKLREEAKKLRQESLLELNQKAMDFYLKRWLPKHFGLIPWKRFLADCRLHRFLADSHCSEKRKIRALSVWRDNWRLCRETEERNTELAIDLYQMTLKQRALDAFKQLLGNEREKRQVAEDFHHLRAAAAAFKKWKRITVALIFETKIKMEEAADFDRRRILTWSLHGWMRLVKEKDAISGREMLRKRLEASVMSTVPDYVPWDMRTQ